MQPTLLQLSLHLLQNAALPVLGVVAYAWLRGLVMRWPGALRAPIEGAFCAALAVLCMMAPLVLMPGVYLDARNAVIATATAFGGPLAGLMTAAAAIAYRFWLGGIGAPGGAVIAAAAYCVALVVVLWLRRQEQAVDFRYLLLLAVGVALSMLLGLSAQPAALAAQVLKDAFPGLIIVPGAVLVMGGIVLLFERARLVERGLLESEGRLRAVIDSLPQPLAIKDRHGRILQFNKAYESAAGIPGDKLVGMDIKDVWAQSTGEGGSFSELHETVWRTGETQRKPPVPVTVDGRHYTIAVTSFPIRGADGQAVAIGTIMNDLTELMEARRSLEQRQSDLQRQQRALIDIVRANAFMEGSLGFTEAVRNITEVAGEVLKVEYAQIWQIDETAELAQCVDEWVRSARRHERAPDANLRQFGELLSDLERDPALVVADAADARFAARREVMAARGVRSGILAGIHLGTRLLGFVGFVDTESSRKWMPEELGFARSVADVLALMLLTNRHREALAALDLVGDAIYVEREDGRVIYANRPARALAGLSDVVAPNYGDASSFPQAPAPLEVGRDLHEIAWTRGKAVKELELHRSRLPGGGVVTLIQDVTQKKSEQRERERLQTQLQQASKMEAIGQLASGIAHDFNNLLGAVIGFARFLEQDLEDGTPQRRFAERILSACNRGRELVSQIMAFTRARALEARPVDLRAVLGETRDLLTGSLPSTTRLLVEAGRRPLVVRANQSQLQQIVVNLCLNAHDAMSGQPGEIAVRLARIGRGDRDYQRTLLAGVLDPAREYARLEVSDTGSGIRPENLARIFEPFFTTKERGRGTGLGLAVVHGIVATYEGACAVASELGVGTCFSVYLPLAATAAAKAQSEVREAAPRGRERLLIVDDDVDITDMLAIGLERLGYETAALNDPREALEAFAEAPAAWDAVITDQLMPGMQGLALAESLKTIRPEVVVILCTGLDDGSIGPSAKENGVDAFLLKPVEPEQIAAAIRRLIPS